MLKKEELQRIITKSQTSPINIYREYCQHLFLSILYTRKGSEQVLFKGGTALKIAYKSPRFSEDLDFTLFNITSRKIEDLLLLVSEGLTQHNLKNQIVEAKQTSGGYLSNFVFYLYQEKVIISIQGSRRKKNNRKANIQLISNDYIPQYTLLLLPEEELVEEKVQAALTRAKPRDFFDVYFLLRQGLIPVGLRNNLASLAETVNENKVDFAGLVDFLPASMTALAKSFKDSFVSEVNKF